MQDDTDTLSEDEKLAAEWEAAAVEDDPAEADGDANSDADLAAEWAAAEADETDEDGLAPRVLNQDEIDSLLGFDDAHGRGEDEDGIMALINGGLVSHERLPMLDIVFDRLVRMMSTSLRNLTSDNIEASLDHVTNIRFGDYLNSVPLPAMMAVFKAEEWDSHGLITVDSALIYSIVDVLLGGRRGTAAMRVEGRPYTTIERTLVERLITVVLSDMAAAFDPLSTVTFRFDRLETNPRFAAITQPANAAVLAKIRVDMEERGGRIELVIPHGTLEPIRDLLLQMFMGEKFGRDPIWETHLSHEVNLTDVELKCVLGETTASLNDVLNWQVGSQVLLPVDPDDPVEMRCGHVPLYSGRMGRRGERIAVRIENEIDPAQED